jgi:hypothetical protein
VAFRRGRGLIAARLLDMRAREAEATTVPQSHDLSSTARTEFAHPFRHFLSSAGIDSLSSSTYDLASALLRATPPHEIDEE